MCHSRQHRRRVAHAPQSDPGLRPSDAPQSDPALRASDADRERTVSRLREHGTAGRLDVEELEQRVGAAYAARTHGELAALVRDLPAGPPARSATRPVDRDAAHAWIPFVQVNVLLVAIWAISGAGYFWPIWVAACWGCALLMKTAPGLLRLR
jgi:hypothetical protein